jgi:N-acetylmuramoyl-L-alanine amidase
MALRRGNVADLGQNFDVQRITNVTLDNRGDGVTIGLQVTGPVQLQWHRLRPPDNRIFVDVPDAVLDIPKQTLDAADGWTNDVTVSQFQVTPRPIVRVVFNMAKPAAFDIKTAGQGNDNVRLSVHNQEVGMTEDTLSGLKVNALPSHGATVVIDPGHGGSDCGAENRQLGMNEKTVTLQIALRLAQLMKKQGWNVFLTRDRDRDVTSAEATNDEELGARCRIANDLHADLFVSIHCNASVNRAAHGTSVHWYKPSDLALARTVMTHMTRELGCSRNSCECDRLYVLRHTHMPAILVETAFITNNAECRLLTSDAYQEKQAQSIFHGLRAYVAVHGTANRRSARR